MYETDARLHDDSMTHSAVCWKSIFAGFLVAMLVMVALMGLGMAFGGIGMDEDTTAKGAGMFSGIWFAASCLISVFAGSFYSARVAHHRAHQHGGTQGLILAALFLGFFLYQTVSALGTAGKAAGSLVGSTASMVGAGAEKAARNPMITNTLGSMVESRMGDLNLKSEPRAVAMGVANRLMDGNVEDAKRFLADQAGMTMPEADARIAQMKVEADKKIDEAKLATAEALRSTGWSLFIVVALTSLAAFGGGMLGSRSRMVVRTEVRPTLRTQTV